ncbi:RHS repeat-associated core domain-containing [Brachionus plicatilis]|uniref:RHS repeat-associated core domain-containing n=1 Tax=Brachionus plicatilis TaxID=10195 RepID=A0A3M7RLV0_BRAPC|nr:RHS repeat-associated core domain-containing [Brachionus plicatilis]
MYQFDDFSSTTQNGMIFYSKFKSIPAGDESKFGYVQYDFDNYISYFNADGKLVKIEMENQQTEIKTISNGPDSHSTKQPILFAKDGRTEVANFYNLDTQNDQADYIGFEEYEQDNSWMYDKSYCVTNRYSLTGTTYFRLVQFASKIERTFRPKENTVYECSCWVRVSKLYSLNDKFEDFKLTIINDNKLIVSKVSSIYKDWLYLTIQVDLRQSKGPISVKCQLEAHLHSSIDVDHIKWMEMNGRVQISSYDRSCSWLLSQIDETNIIKRIIYNESREPFVVIDSNNELLQSGFSYNWNKTHVQIDANSSVFVADYSDFGLKKNWSLDNPADWTRSDNLLCHVDCEQKSTIRLIGDILDKSCIAIYFRIQLGSSSQLSLELNSHQFVFKSEKILVNDHKVESFGNGFYLLVAINGRIIVWKDRDLLIDKKFDLAKKFTGVAFTTSGLVKLSDVLVINEPVLKVNHVNSFEYVCQSIQLETDSSVIVKEKICDEMLRDSIETKPTRVFIQKNEPSLAYRHDFVTNKSFDSESSVWQTKKLQGKIAELNPSDEGFSYQRKIYSKDPLNYVESVEFAEQLLNHKIIPNYSQNNSFEYFASLFPVQDGFVCQTSIEPNGNRTIKVYNRHNKMVALFQHTNNFKDALTTYEFDDNQNLVKILPPLYHAQVFTLEQFDTTYEKLNQLWNSSEKYLKLQQQMGSFYVHDEDSNCLTEMRTPERGLEKMVYNKLGLLRFNLRFNSDNEPIILEYSNYNQWGEVNNKGFSRNKAHFDIEWLKSNADSANTDLADSDSMQSSISDVSIKPGLNGKICENLVKNTSNKIEYNERISFSAMDKVVEKSSLLKRPDGSSIYMRMEREYVGTQLQSIIYPFSLNDHSALIKLNYKYNTQGLVSVIRIGDKKLAEFDYTANGSLSSETIFTNSSDNFKRSFSYNSSGMLTTQDDGFMQESLSYSKNGYECEKDSYDTSISRTKFVPKWHDKCDVRSLAITQDILIERLDNLNEMEASYLLNLLVHHEYLDQDFRVIRNLTTSDALVKLPLKFDECSINKIICLLNEHFPHATYGHQYSYGAHSELVNSKYFLESGNEENNGEGERGPGRSPGLGFRGIR